MINTISYYVSDIFVQHYLPPSSASPISGIFCAHYPKTAMKSITKDEKGVYCGLALRTQLKPPKPVVLYHFEDYGNESHIRFMTH